jgi:hypothetical protein
MANMISVPVIYDPEENTLKLPPEKETVTLNNPDDWVHWFIESGPPVPDGANLAILFDTPLGPFQTVRSFNSLNLAAKGNLGPPAAGQTSVFPYHLYLIPQDLSGENPAANLTTGGPFAVNNQSQTTNSSPWLTVTLDAFGQIERVDPDHLLLFDGDVAFWKIEGPLPPNHVVAFRFADPPHFPGPFPTYFSTRAGGEGDHRQGVANFGSVTGTRNYVIKIWDQNGHFLAGTEDPSVDGLGRPPGT